MTDLTSATVTDDPEKVHQLVNIHTDPYKAATGAHAIVICTEWDEFTVIAY
jgi:UDPglucose 6-dehydrogenase